MQVYENRSADICRVIQAVGHAGHYLSICILGSQLYLWSGVDLLVGGLVRRTSDPGGQNRTDSSDLELESRRFDPTIAAAKRRSVIPEDSKE